MSRIKIRHAEIQDIKEINRVYDAARNFMRASGNATQWINGYPAQKNILADIEGKNLYVGEDAEGRIVMAFAFIIGDDSTYDVIEDGKWLNCKPYGTIHRIGSDGSMGGMLREALDFCFSLIPNIRIDTHKDNKKMLQLLKDEAFIRCGVIYCQDGTAREAFQADRS